MRLPISLGLFVLAGLCEIRGGYLWALVPRRTATCLRNRGSGHSFLYGIIPTFQPAHFNRALCSIGRNVYRVIPVMGMEYRRSPTGSL